METEKYNEVLELVKSDNFLERTRRGDQQLFKFFRQTENLKALIDVICNPNNYFYAKKIQSFFQSSDTSVTELFITKLEIAEYAFLRISENLDYPLQIGILANIFGRCTSVFPDTTSDCFRRSTIILGIIVKMLENPSFMQIACDESTTTPYRNIPHFVYRLFLTICGDRIEKIKDYIPDYFLLFPPYPCDVPKDINDTQFISIVTVIKNYLLNVMKEGRILFEVGLQCRTFEAMVREYIKLEIGEIDVNDSKNAKLILFDLAVVLNEDPDIEKLALKFIEASVSSVEVSQAPINYLAKYNSAIQHSEVVSLFKTTAEKSPRNIILCQLIYFFKSIFSRTKDESFITEIGDIIKSSWEGSNRKMRAFFIEVSGSLDRELASKIIGSGFITKVVNPYFSTEEGATEIPEFNISVENFI